ncbi:UNVERIFIED_CONTAM: protein SEMI-ROLLED LEAF 2 [Sesamum latifolium]|uniref:Protein SEMI-ROLLED LEAF 2 n=1 Tax=Sesamum latifolium TaxID=2727402 RepID=A0AAW2VJK9_9LAMI
MSAAVSGVISRQVLPACGSLCFFCPALRERSRQPVKRYKKLISDIFPKSLDEEPNDRKIGKLCEYAAKNPLRIPKIANSLEQRCYKELRNENFRAVKVVMCIYRKFFSLQGANTSQDEMLVIGCHSVFDFVNNQKDDTKLCQLAQEQETMRGQKIYEQLPSKLYLLWFVLHSINLCIVFKIASFEDGSQSESVRSRYFKFSRFGSWVRIPIFQLNLIIGQDKESEEDNKSEEAATPDQGVARVPSWRLIVDEKGQLNVTAEESNSPSFWSRVCLQNMAKLGKEATTMRRVLESLFRYFDNGNLWPIQFGIAFPVLKDMQLVMDDSGQNTHFLLSILIKHLDHKNVLKLPDMQLDIVEVVTALVRLTKVQSSVAIVSAVSDIMRHLRKSIHYTLDDANLGNEVIKWNRKFHQVVDECLTELSSKVASLGVPGGFIHQLIPAMLHPDYVTRIGAHQIFSIVLVPSSVAPQANTTVTVAKKNNMVVPRTLSRTVSVFSSSAALFEKLKNQKGPQPPPAEPIIIQRPPVVEGDHGPPPAGVMNRIKSTYSRVYSFRHPPAPEAADGTTTNPSKEPDAVPLRLSSHQITLLLSSIWEQSLSNANMPENYEAIAHTYSLVLLFSRAKLDEGSVRQQLLEDFSHDDLCSLGGQLFSDSPKEGQDSKLEKAVSLFGIDDDPRTDSVESNVPQNAKLTIEFPSLLSVDQLLQSVLETAHHVGRMSVSTAPDTSYRDMANHCETLLVGRQQKMSYLISTNSRHGNLMQYFTEFFGETDKQIAPYAGVHKSGNPFLDQNMPGVVPGLPVGGPPVLCATEYQQHPHSFSLPASSPYDNFLKAAGC